MKKQLRNILVISHLLAVYLVDVCQPAEDHEDEINRLILPDALATVGRVFQYQIPRINGSNTTQYYVSYNKDDISAISKHSCLLA